MKRQITHSLPLVIILYISEFLTTKINLWKTSKAINQALNNHIIFNVDQINQYRTKLKIEASFKSKMISSNIKELYIVDDTHKLRYIYFDNLKCIYSPNATSQVRTNDVLQIHSNLDKLQLLSIQDPISILSDKNITNVNIRTLILKSVDMHGFDFFQKCNNVNNLEITLTLYFKFQAFKYCQDLTHLTINANFYSFVKFDLQDYAKQVSIICPRECVITKLPQNIIDLNLEVAYNCKIDVHFPNSLQTLKLSHLKSKMLHKISQSQIQHLSFKSISESIQHCEFITLPLSLQSLTISKKLTNVLNLAHCKCETYHQKLDDSLCVFQCNQKNWNPVIHIW